MTMSTELTEREQEAIDLIDSGMGISEARRILDISFNALRMALVTGRAKIAESGNSGTFRRTLRLRDVDDVLDEVEQGLRCKGCHLLFTPRSTCTPKHCDARDDVFNAHLPAIRALMETMNALGHDQ